MPSCISSCSFPSQLSHLPASSSPACCLSCLRRLCSVILYLTSGAERGCSFWRRSALSSGWSSCSPSSSPSSLGVSNVRCLQTPLPSLYSALPASSWRGCLMAWAGGCHQAGLLPVPVQWQGPCSPVTAPERAPGRAGEAPLACCLVARLGSAATGIFSTDSNTSFHWKHLV